VLLPVCHRLLPEHPQPRQPRQDNNGGDRKHSGYRAHGLGLRIAKRYPQQAMSYSGFVPVRVARRLWPRRREAACRHVTLLAVSRAIPGYPDERIATALTPLAGIWHGLRPARQR
jgi:hypothetical protein